MKPKKNIKGLVITHVVEEGLVFLLEVEEVVEQTSKCSLSSKSDLIRKN